MSRLSLALLFLFGVAGTANAGLVDSNEAGLGVSADGNNLTRDTVTDRYWLDLDLYTGQSYDTVAAVIAAGTVLPGFVIADRTEVYGFFTAMNFSVDMSFNIKDFPDVNGLTFGEAASHTGTGPTTTEMNGFTRDTIIWGVLQHYIASAIYLGFDTSRTMAAAGSIVPPDNYHVNRGTWIYRTGAASVVPEPSTFSMLAFCGIAMAGYTRLRRRRK
jgi:hypothetical protein